jgi:periplasmic protein TonB
VLRQVITDSRLSSNRQIASAAVISVAMHVFGYGLLHLITCENQTHQHAKIVPLSLQLSTQTSDVKQAAKTSEQPQPRRPKRIVVVPSPEAASVKTSTVNEVAAVSSREQATTTDKNLDSQTQQTGTSATEMMGDVPQNEYEHFLAKLRTSIAQKQRYPPASKSMGEEGLVKLKVTLTINGELIDIQILESSSIGRLDQAAIKAVQTAAPFDPIPFNTEQDVWSFALPIRFQLRL